MLKPGDAAALSRRIRESIVKPYQVDGHQIVIGYQHRNFDRAESMESSRISFSRTPTWRCIGAKADGRGMYRFFEAEMDTRMKVRAHLEMDLRQALVNGEFELYYQPLFNFRPMQISAFEALLRWHHPCEA